ncbi:hypothetical protein ILUMI_21328 [Ignelater luminosus]|uniref:TGF-beta family profile domain-containing protein n=1 Tax=Ignelater luminosus TaxID=2038154 RepID=A0A8K0G3P8_IGNLU|nr:hypothetical protein ILUMI_21328 [Ignelater luminosus]
MGGHFWAHIATWTFLCSVRVVRTDQDLEQDFDLNILPDVTKVNISQDEYVRMMTTYLHRLRDSADHDAVVPDLKIFDAEQNTWRRRKKCITRLKFPKMRLNPNTDIEQAELRMLMSEFPDAEAPVIQIYQIIGLRRRRLIEERQAYLSTNASKWCEFDITNGVRAWLLNGDRNFSLELQCSQCNTSVLQPLQVALSILGYSDKRRVRRASPYHDNNQQGGRTDCTTNSAKQRCCRHSLTVSFKDLKVPQISSIIQPKSYEAGFCKGRCPYNYNHATNHSRIQSLVHKLDRKAVPRVCCAPSKLAPLDILRVDPYDFTKLNVEKWDNMRVLECACS